MKYILIFNEKYSLLKHPLFKKELSRNKKTILRFVFLVLISLVFIITQSVLFENRDIFIGCLGGMGHTYAYVFWRMFLHIK